MKHLLTLSERSKDKWVGMVNLVMQFLKLTKLTEQIFAESLKSLKSLMSNFAGNESYESAEGYRVKSRITTPYLRLASVFTLVFVLGVGNVWGEDEVYKTALFGSSYNSKGVSDYTNVSFSSTNDGFTVDVVNANNNNNGWNFIKIGGNKAAYTGTITTKAAIDKAITKVVLTIDAITANNVTSITLKTSSNGSSWSDAGTFTKATGTKTVTLSSPTANLYYKIEAVCTKGSSNGLLTISKVEYYVEKDESAPTLESIAINGDLSNKLYEEGQELDFSGLTATGTYSDSNTDDITDDVEWSFTPALAVGTTSYTVTATLGEISGNKVINGLTVTKHVVTPGEYVINLNNTFYGISTGNNATEQSASKNDIMVVSGCKSNASTKTYYDAGHIRYYADSYLHVSVPSGFLITTITFTANGTWNGGITANVGTYTAADKQWEGKAQEVDFTFTAQNRIATATVTYEAVAPEVTVSPTSLSFTGKQHFAVEGKNFMLTGANLSSGLILAASAGYNVSPTSISASDAMAQGGVAVTVTPATPETATTPVNGTVTISGGGIASNVVVNLSMTVTPTYAVAMAVNDNTMGSATMDGGTVNVYKASGETVALVATPSIGHEFVNWTATSGISFNNANNAEATATITAAGTITANFKEQACTGLAAPILNGITKTYNSATIAWNAVANASVGYEVYVYNDAQKTSTKVSDLITDGSSFAVADLAANTTYYYTIMAVGDGTSYCDENNELLEGSFTTNDYPAATLTLHDANGSSDFAGSHKLFDVIELPSTAAACSKTFMGWSANAECAVAPEIAKGANYTLNEISQDLYAVYADITGGGTSTTNIAYTGSTTATLEDGENEADVFGLDESDWSVISHKHSANTVGVNKEGTIRLYYNAGGNTSLEIIAPQTITSVGVTCKAGNDNIIVKVGNNAITLEDGVYTINATSFEIVNGYTTSTQVHIQNIAVNFTTPGVASNYTTTCAATPVAEASPTNLNDIAAAGASGTITMSYEHVNTTNVAVALYNDAACEDAFSGEWLTASLDVDKNITYTIAANTSYNNARSAYIKLTAPETSGATDPAVVVIPVSQVKKPAVFASLADLAIADVAANTNVTVTLTNEVIKEIYYYPNNTSENNRKGIVFNVQKNDADVKIYFASGVVPAAWVAGGKVSGTLTDCPWKTYQSTWQLSPANTWAWDQLTYTAPPAITSLEIRGAASKKTYIDGQAFDHIGLTAIAIYDNSEEEDVTGYATWTYAPAKLSEGDTEVEVSAEYLGHSDSETVTGLTVNPIPNKTIAEFIAAGGTRCYLEGIVSNYTNTTKGYFDLTDASGTLYIYGCTSPSSFAAGDKVRVIAETYEYYQSTTHEAKNVEFVSKVSPVAITITDAGSLSVEKGLTLTINATTDPVGAVANITYNVKAGSEDYASVEGNVVTGKAKGTATIIASIPAGEGYLANSVEFEVDVVEYFSITYEENGGSTVADVAKALALPNPLPETTKENYTFNGWFTTSTFDAETEAVAGATLTGNVTLYAKWTEIPVWARTYGSNVTLVGGGTSHEDANVVINAESYPAEKAGASKNEGTVSITVPAGTNAVHFHGFAWKGQSVTVSVAASPAVTNLSASSFDLAGDAAGSSSSPYTITSNPVNHYNFFTFDAVEEATTFTFSKTGGSDNRFILYGVNAIYPEITLSPASYDFENVRANATKEQVFTISTNENVSGMLSASIIEDASSKYSVSPIEDNKVTVTFNPDGAESGTFTAKLKITASNASVIADLSGTAISAAAPMIVTDKSSIAFGRIEPNAEASAMVAVELQNIDEDGVTAELSGEDAGKFALSPTKLTADGNLVITPTTSAQGIFSATLTLSATDADDVVLPISMTVASKWATTYTSNVEVSANENKKVKVGSDETEFAARKTNTGATATIHLPMGTQKLHLHMVAWKGEEGTVTVSGDCFSSSKSIEVPANDVVSGATGTYTFTDAQALSYYHEIAIDNEIGAGGINVTVSKSGSRIVLFGVNQEGGTYEIEDDANISTLPENANVEVKNGVTLTVDAVSTLDNLIVEAGGKVTGTSDLTVVNDLLIKTSLGNIAGDDSNISGVSGEIANSNISATGDVFIEIELTQEAEASEGWYAFSVPFPVDAMNGVYYGDTKLTNEVGYAIMSYHGDVRAQGLYGWKKYRGIMQPGVLYIITVGDTDYKTLRFKKVAGENIVASNVVSVNKYASETGNEQDGGWNGIGNPNLQVSNYSATTVMQFLDHSNNCFRPRISSQINLLVGSAFMMQIQTTTTITITVGNSGSIALAPARERSVEENTLYELKLRNTETNAVEDNLFFSASEDATNTYEIGRDVAKFSMGAAKCAQMYVPAYGTQLCAADFPLVNGQAEYPLAITAPAAGSYRIETPTVYEDATLYLTYEGNIIWDLTVSPYEAEFDKGQNNDYGLMLVRKAPQVTTGVENVQGDKTQCTKVILNDHVYILRDAQLYDVTGKAVK